MKFSRAKLQYFVDAVIGIAFLVAAASGIVFLFAGSGGYQGGRNPRYAAEILSLSRATWSDLHTYGSLVMIFGVGVHLLLHAKWILKVTKNLFKRKASVEGAFRSIPRTR